MSEHIVVCPQCCLLNTILDSALSSESECKECAGLLLPKIAIEANEKLFNQFIQHSTLPFVVEFWGPCSTVSQGMVDTVSSLANTFSKDALFLRINGEQEQVLANQFKLINIPTFILFSSGLEYHRLHGMISEREFHRWLERYLRVKREKKEHHRSSV